MNFSDVEIFLVLILVLLVVSLALKWEHIVCTVLNLEVFIIFMFYTFLLYIPSYLNICMYILFLGVMESVFVLSLVVFIFRSFNSFNMKSFIWFWFTKCCKHYLTQSKTILLLNLQFKILLIKFYFFFFLIFFLMLSHPFFLSLILFSLFVFLCLTTYSIPVYWYLFLLIMIYLGGILILLIYITSFSSMIIFSNLIMSSLIVSFLYSCMISFLIECDISFFSFSSQTNLLSFLNTNSVSLVLLLLSFMLLVLFVTMKLMKFHFGPLRSL